MAVTLREVALRAGVSRSAVSRAFTPGAPVSERTRARVAAAAAELGYNPSALASALTTGRTKLIGLISDNFRNPALLEVFDRFTKGLQDREFRPLLVNLSGSMDRDAAIRLLRRYSVDGVIVASSTLPPDFARGFWDAGLPVVHCFGRSESEEGAPHLVGVDNRAAGRLAARTLIVRGYRRIGFLGGPGSATSTQDRLAGFRHEARRHAGVGAAESFAASYTFAAGRSEMRRLLASGAPAEAYFCGDDILSIGAMSALRECGFTVPGHVGVLGMNDMEMAGWAGIELTTIRQPVAAIIDTSIEMIVAAIRNPGLLPQVRRFDCALVERGTLRPLPA
ncbi:MAG: LacI family DNA-binding transcriptional regulator [Paracoccaceae bacterium]